MSYTPKTDSIRAECLIDYNDGWVPPTPAEVRYIVKKLGFSRSEFASFVGVASTTTARRWMAENTKGENSDISYSSWRLLVLELKRRNQPAKN